MANNIPNDILADKLIQQAQMYQLLGLVGKINRNLDLIINGGNGAEVELFTANLFQMAAKEYGDAMKWTVIAEANNLYDPMINSPTPITLVIPKSGKDTGGVITQ